MVKVIGARAGALINHHLQPIVYFVLQEEVRAKGWGCGTAHIGTFMLE